MVSELKCKRCGWEWIQRQKSLPIQCPNKTCHSPYWNKERLNRGKNAASETKPPVAGLPVREPEVVEDWGA